MSRAFVYGVIVSTLEGESVKFSSSFLVTSLAINSYLFYALHFFFLSNNKTKTSIKLSPSQYMLKAFPFIKTKKTYLI